MQIKMSMSTHYCSHTVSFQKDTQEALNDNYLWKELWHKREQESEKNLLFILHTFEVRFFYTICMFVSLF